MHGNSKRPITSAFQLVIWVDPLDGTAEYTQGKKDYILSLKHK